MAKRRISIHQACLSPLDAYGAYNQSFFDQKAVSMNNSLCCIRSYQEGDEDALLKRGLRVTDQEEARKLWGIDASKALQESILASQEVWTAFLAKRIVALFGLRIVPLYPQYTSSSFLLQNVLSQQTFLNRCGIQEEPLGIQEEPLGIQEEPLGIQEEPLGIQEEPPFMFKENFAQKAVLNQDNFEDSIRRNVYGIPWYIGHSDLNLAEYAILIARQARYYVQCWRKRCAFLENYTLASHVKTHHFLRWLGFSLETVVGSGSQEYTRFYL